MYPDKLVSKVYQARYCRNGTFLNAMLSCNPSYVWRIVLEAQNLLKYGAVYLIGNGGLMNILEEPWLPSDDPYIHSTNEALVNQKVSSLMITSH